jgi:ADP-ribose pyrophosphatase YjhB (NUDIX family)
MIGDSPHDIEAGSACRVATAAVLGGQGSKSDLRAASPENVFADPRELLSFLREDQERATDRLVIPTVGGFIIDGESGKILLVRTRKWSGLWGLPGGKIDVGETMEQAWLREAKEETGLELEGSEFLLVQDSVFSKEFVDRRHFLLINFVSVVRDASGLRLNHEIAESAWVSPSAAEAMELNEPTRVALAWARQKGLLEGDS